MLKTCFRWIIVLSVIFIGGCDFSSIELDKVKGPTLNNSFAFNIGNIKYTVSELVEDLEDERLEVVEGDDLLLTFVYLDTTVFSDIDEFVILDDIRNVERYSPFDISIPAQTTETEIVLPTREFSFTFDPEGGEAIDSTFFKEGTLEYTLTSDFNAQIDYTFTLRDVQDRDNIPVTFNSVLPQGQTNNSESIPLVGLKNVSRRIGGSNIFNVDLDLTFTIPAGTPINAGDEISVELIFDDPRFYSVFGDFGMDPVDVQEDSIEIDVFEEFNNGGLFLGSPSITMEFENKFGVELGVDLNGVKSVDSDNSEIALTGDVVNSSQFVDAPNSTILGQSVISFLTIDTNNSNIDDLLNSTPDRLVFSVIANPNPAGSDNEINYLFDSSFLEIRSSMEIPLDLRMDGFSKDFDISISGSDLEDADSLIINARVVNEIPFNGTLNLSFRNDDGNEIYVLNDIAIIESPSIGSDGRTIGAQESISPIRLNEEGIDAFLETTEIVA
ncbi:MAG: hypothetical protein AAF391_08340 [Bacteroidota bacterium]